MAGFFEPRVNHDPNCQPWHLPASPWTRPRVRIITGQDSDFVAAEASAMLADPKISVCAVSPALPGTNGTENGAVWIQYTLTVIYQERVDPNGGGE